MKFIKPNNLVHSCSASTRYTPEVDQSSVASLEKTPFTFSSDIHHINHITYYIEWQDYVLTLFLNIDDADVDLEDYYDVMINLDARADSLVEYPKPRAYLLKVTLTDDVSSG